MSAAPKLPLLAAVLLLSGCATPQTRLRQAGRAQSTDDFLHRPGDTEVWTVSSSSAALCAAGFAG